MSCPEPSDVPEGHPGARVPGEEVARARPARALRRDVPARPRIRLLADALAERRRLDAQRDAARRAVAGEPAWTAGVPTGRGPVGPVGSSGSADAGSDQAALEAVAAGVRPLVVRVLGAVAEVSAGRRPAHHLAPLCDPPVYERVAARLTRLADPRARVGGLRVCAVSADAVEVAAVLHGARRSRAVAARLERVAGTVTGTDRSGPAWRVRSLTVL